MLDAKFQAFECFTASTQRPQIVGCSAFWPMSVSQCQQRSHFCPSDFGEAGRATPGLNDKISLGYFSGCSGKSAKSSRQRRADRNRVAQAAGIFAEPPGQLTDDAQIH